MALSKNQISQLKAHLDDCKNPLFLFDDDQDGLCSFLLFYRYKQEGKGIIVKTTPKIGDIFLNKVHEYGPDKVFVLDIAEVEQNFIDEAKAPVIWVDHHGPYQRNNVKYFNPRVSEPKDNFPTSFLCYSVVERDMWIAMTGCIADWFVPPFLKEFMKEFPDLIDEKFKNAGDIIYNTKLGHLTRVLSFILKGKTNDVMKCVKVMTRIQSPYEILHQKTSQGKFIYKRYEQINKMYEPLIKEVLHTASSTKDKLIIYTYKDDTTSFTSDLSNEVTYRYPNNVILIARGKNDEMKCSLRSSKLVLPPLIQKCLVGLDGYGGGHEHACGLNIKTRDFEEFVRRLREMI